MASSTLLPLIKANLQDIIWCKLNNHFFTHFKDYNKNESVFVACEALKCVDATQGADLQDMAVMFQEVDVKELVQKCINKLSKPTINEGRTIVLLYFVVELCKVYVGRNRLDLVDVLINEFHSQLDTISPIKPTKSLDHKFLKVFGWISILALFLYSPFILIQ